MKKVIEAYQSALDKIISENMCFEQALCFLAENDMHHGFCHYMYHSGGVFGLERIPGGLLSRYVCKPPEDCETVSEIIASLKFRIYYMKKNFTNE